MKCSVCGKDKEPYKRTRVFCYCKECWDECFAKVFPIAMQKLHKAKQDGQKIDVGDIHKIVKEIGEQK